MSHTRTHLAHKQQDYKVIINNSSVGLGPSWGFSQSDAFNLKYTNCLLAVGQEVNFACGDKGTGGGRDPGKSR